MQSNDSVRVVCRFFVALQLLKEFRVIRGKKSFTDRYGINRWNMNTCEREPSRDLFQVSWLSYLVRDYGVSPLWLLTGDGEMWTVPPPVPRKNLQMSCKKN
jgi:hypothetical protein